MSALRTHRVLVESLPKSGTPVPLEESEASHLTRVLRLQDGAEIECLDGKGGWVKAILHTHKKGATVTFESALEAGPRGIQLPLGLELALLKGDAMEWAVEKATELGVSDLYPVLCDYGVVQIKGKSPESFQERWQKISDQALKQCGRVYRMRVHLPQSIRDHITLGLPAGAVRYWCAEDSARDESHPHLGAALGSEASIRLLVGPEGGFSPDEKTWLLREQATRPISLGPWILRAESAALAACTLSAQHLLDRA